MPRIAGIATRKNTKGKITHITIDVKKHPDLAQPLLEQAGLNEKLSFKEEWE